MVVSSIFFLALREYLSAVACLFVALAAPGLMPKEAYPLAQQSNLIFIRKAAAFFASFTGLCRVLCFAAIIVWICKIYQS